MLLMLGFRLAAGHSGQAPVPLQGPFRELVLPADSSKHACDLLEMLEQLARNCITMILHIPLFLSSKLFF